MAWVSDHLTRRTWDPDRNLTIHFQSVRDTETFTILENDQPVIWFDGRIRSGAWLSEEEQRKHPGFKRREIWHITKDDGIGRFADQAVRRAMIVEFLESFQAGGGVSTYDQGVPVFAKISVLFDQPFSGV